jgi:hypothetical protein
MRIRSADWAGVGAGPAPRLVGLFLGLLLAACAGPRLVDDGGAGVDGPLTWDAAVPDLGPPNGSGLLHVAAVDDETRIPLPARVLISPVPTTPPVRFDVDPATGESLEGADGPLIAPGVYGAPEGVLVAAGAGTFPVPPGQYRVFVTHGPEWEAYEAGFAIDGEHDAFVDADGAWTPALPDPDPGLIDPADWLPR